MFLDFCKALKWARLASFRVFVCVFQQALGQKIDQGPFIRTRIINLPTNQKGCDTFETSV